MTERQRQMVDALNDMYTTQGRDYRTNYRENYFTLLEYITRARSEDMTYDDIRQKLKDVEREKKLEQMAAMK